MLDIITPFILLLVIMDPILGLGALMSFAKDRNNAELRRIAFKSVAVATFVFLLFVFTGDILLTLLGVSLNSFRAAGGIVLILLGVQLALGISFPKKDADISEIAVVIGTPLITGPATISATILLVNDLGLITTLTAGILALAIVLVLLLLAPQINKLIGRSGMQVLSTMMGIVTIAWGMQFLVSSLVSSML